MPIPQTTPVIFHIPNGSGGIDDVQVDACITETHALNSTLTDHPVEQGFNVTDHSRPEPRRVSLDCIVSNTPLASQPNPNPQLGPPYALSFWLRLVALHDSPQLVSVDTIRDSYRSMGVESVSSAVEVKSANALRFTVALKQIRVVQNRFIKVTVAKVNKAHAKQKAGAGTTAPAERESSLLVKIDGATGGHASPSP